MAIKLHTVFEDDALRVTVHEAGGSVGAIAFAGIGSNVGSLPEEEFVGTLSRLPSVGPVFFVVDKARSWYNSVDSGLAALLNSELERRNIHHSVAVGNSMGGFGAIALAPQIPSCRRVLAFSPQYSVRNDLVPFEHRWIEERSRIHDWQFPTACEWSGGPDLVLVVGGRSKQDLRHADLIRAKYSGTATLLLARHCHHNVPASMKHAAILSSAIEALLIGPASEIAALQSSMEQLKPVNQPDQTPLTRLKRFYRSLIA